MRKRLGAAPRAAKEQALALFLLALLENA